jgi:hypothetical protein
MRCVRRYSRSYKARLCRGLPLFHLYVFLFLCPTLLAALLDAALPE